ncbi:mycothiol synthase [Nocardioides sp. SYSU D00038]|uniref:mycothiol synthase n=1 Tax=Nocardioides sp. SYSU D00038 TaxID=2812554 RepID=UPI001966EC5C|nr:mycothiol synthase [Nocardioides sp. SYSU D00038]
MSVDRVAASDFTWGGEGPAAVVAAVRTAAREHDGHDPLDEAATLRLKHHGLDGARLWVAGDDGFALRHGADDVALELAVRPEARRRGLGGALAAAALTDPGPLSAWSHGDHPAAARLAERHGLARVRELWLMRRPAAVPLPDAPAPDGLTIRGYRDDDAADLLRVNAAAFHSHPEQGGMDADDLAQRMAEDWYDPAGLLVAERDGRLVGFHWTKQHSATLGEVYVVGVDPDEQGGGLGRVLTVAGLAHLAGLGVDEVILYVESDNAPAIAIYRDKVGFGHAAADTHVQYRRPA